MLDKLAALFSNGQVTAAVIALVDAIFGLLVATGAVSHAPDSGLISSVIAVSFTAAGIVLAYIQHSQHVVKLQLAHAVTEAAAYRAAYPNLGSPLIATPVS